MYKRSNIQHSLTTLNAVNTSTHINKIPTHLSKQPLITNPNHTHNHTLKIHKYTNPHIKKYTHTQTNTSQTS